MFFIPMTQNSVACTCDYVVTSFYTSSPLRNFWPARHFFKCKNKWKLLGVRSELWTGWSKTFTAVISQPLPPILYLKCLDNPRISWPVKCAVFKKYVLCTLQSIIPFCYDYCSSVLNIILTACPLQCNNIVYNSGVFSSMLCMILQITGEFMCKDFTCFLFSFAAF
jgi:hypothetical protein